MFMPDDKILNFERCSRPIIIYRDREGNCIGGRVLKDNEIITTFDAFSDACKNIGLFIVDSGGKRI